MSTCTALIPVQQFTSQQLLDDPPQLLLELFQTRQQAHYWKAQFQRCQRARSRAPTANPGTPSKKSTNWSINSSAKNRRRKTARKPLSSAGGQWKTVTRTTAWQPRPETTISRSSAQNRRYPRPARKPKAMSSVRLALSKLPRNRRLRNDRNRSPGLPPRHPPQAVPPVLSMSSQIPASSPRLRCPN